MDKERLEKLEKLAQQKKESVEQKKADQKQFLDDLNKKEEKFTKSFKELQNTVFMPSVKLTAKAIAQVGRLEYTSNESTKTLKDQTRLFGKIAYLPKGYSDSSIEAFLLFEGYKTHGTIEISQKSLGKNAEVKKQAGYTDIEKVKKEDIESLIYQFVEQFLK